MKKSELTQKLRSSSTLNLCSLCTPPPTEQTEFLRKQVSLLCTAGRAVKVKPRKPPTLQEEWQRTREKTLINIQLRREL